MLLRDALDIKKGTQQVNKIYKGTYKVWDKNRKVLEGYCRQNTTTGKNLFNPVTQIENTNIYLLGCTATVENGIFTFTATDTSFNFGTGRGSGGSYINDRGFLIEAKSSTNYAVSLSNNNFYRCYITEYDENKISLGGFSIYGSSGTFTTKSSTKYFTVSLFYTDATIGRTYSTTVQVEEGNSITDYEPYTNGASPNPNYEQPIEVMEGRQIVTIKGTQYIVDLKSKNLIENKLLNATLNGITYKNNNGKITLNGTASSGTAFRIDQSTPIGSDNLKAYSAGTYTLSCPQLQDNMELVLMQNNTFSMIARMKNNNTPVIVNINEVTDCFIYIFIGNGKTLNNLELFPQLEKSPTATDFEPYYDYKLAGIGDVKDNIYTDKGGWYFEKKFYNKKFNGSETFTEAFDVLWGTNVYINTAVYDSKAWGKSIANYFRDAKISSITPLTENGQMQIVQDNSIIFKNDDITTAQDFKTWLSTHNTDAWYELGTAQKIPIPSTYTTLINQLNALYQAM